MTHFLHRNIHEELPVAVKGEGVYIFDSSGKRYIDASGGAAVSCLGHGDAEVTDAIKRQLDKLAFAHTAFFTTEVLEELASSLIEDAPPGIERAYFTCSGSEAIESALKITRQYFLETGQPNRRNFIARLQSYHGNTLGALSVGGHYKRRAAFEPLLMDSHHISPCYAYRGMEPGETETQYGLRVADELEAKIQELGPETVAAFVAETVVGASIGAAPPAPGYFKRIREICGRHGVLLILDEVMCGSGRTGTYHACEQEGVAPDVMALAKGLAAGYQPTAAVLLSGRIFEAFEKGKGGFLSGHTYMGHPVACAAALAVRRAVLSRGLLANVLVQGEALAQGLLNRLGDHPHVGDIRGRGLFRGIELVRDRTTKEPFDPELKVHARIKRLAMERGLICYPAGGTADGIRGDHVLLAPPFIADSGHIAEIVDLVAGVIEDTTKAPGNTP